LDYENQPYQIRWARLHARQMIETADAVRKELSKNPSGDMDALVDEKLDSKYIRALTKRIWYTKR
jgi:hypothetical protein